MKNFFTLFTFLTIALLVSNCKSNTKTATASNNSEKWIQLFNGKNLDGWTPKIRGHKVGENFNNTFRVEDGVLKVNYDQYDGKFKESY